MPSLENRVRAKTVDSLRRLLPRMEGFSSDSKIFSFGLRDIDRHLPRGGLALAALHEVVPADEADRPTAFGFAAALTGRMARAGPVLLIRSAQDAAGHGHPHGHGLSRLGLDPARVILAEADDDLQALWAMEEALRSAVPAAVVGTIGTGLDLTASKRLQLAAGHAGIPLVLLLPAQGIGSSAAATRWRIGAAPAGRDDYGLVGHPRWRARLERCRNGRPGEWVMEFDHAYRFGLAAAVAHPALPDRGRPRAAAHAG